MNTQTNKYLGLQTNNFIAGRKRQRIYLLLMAVPFIIHVLIFYYGPLWGWIIAFLDYYPGAPITKSDFIGLDNFITLFSGGSEFLKVMRNTLVFNSLNLLMSIFPIILAIMLTECRSSFFGRIAQTISSFPNFVSWIIVYSVFFNFLSSDDGFINIMMQKLDVISQPIPFLQKIEMVWPLQTFISVWKSAGWTSIMYIAAIASIDQELYQAAMVDGAGRFNRIWHITIPGIMPTFIVLLLLSVGNMLSAFDQYFMFYNGLVHDHIEVLDTYAYRQGIVMTDYSFATAVGIFKTGVSVFLLTTVNLFAKLTTNKSIL